MSVPARVGKRVIEAQWSEMYRDGCTVISENVMARAGGVSLNRHQPHASVNTAASGGASRALSLPLP
eukprot:scaffold100728_cov35-Tisochrysis_lutea.AAC.7